VGLELAEGEIVGKGLGALFVDVDGDHRPDLYVANDITPNHLFVNSAAGFRDESLLSGTAVNAEGAAEAGMGRDALVVAIGGGSIGDVAGFFAATWMRGVEWCPVATTVMGHGIFPPDHALALGCLGMHGAKVANAAVNEADLVLALGVRFDDRVTGRVMPSSPRADHPHR